MTKQIPLLIFSLLTFSLLARTQNTYNEITLPELMKKKQQGDPNLLIVDVRTKGEYGDTSRNRQSNIGRIKGATNITLQDLQKDSNAVKQLDPYRDKDIYLICSHSYRSRSASNILLKNGFTHVNNVRGGMTEWYRRYDELAAYRDAFLERDMIYNTLSPSELLNELMTGKNVLLLGIRSVPKFWFDTANINLYQYFPLLKNTVYFNYADSLKILEEVQKDKNRPVVLFNMVTNGAAELAEWLAQKGSANVSYLVGGITLFYEFVSNKQSPATIDKLFDRQSSIRFLTPLNYCGISGNKNLQLVDIRHDSLFNKVNEGVKHNYRHLKNALNYYSGKGADEFEKEFPDKSREYIFINAFSSFGIELADALTKRGYKMAWLSGGMDRWEWYMNNVEDFRCNDLLVE